MRSASLSHNTKCDQLFLGVRAQSLANQWEPDPNFRQVGCRLKLTAAMQCMRFHQDDNGQTIPTVCSSPSQIPVRKHIKPSSNHLSCPSLRLFPLSLVDIARANCCRSNLIANSDFGSMWYRIFRSSCSDDADSYAA